MCVFWGGGEGVRRATTRTPYPISAPPFICSPRPPLQHAITPFSHLDPLLGLGDVVRVVAVVPVPPIADGARSVGFGGHGGDEGEEGEEGEEARFLVRKGLQL